MNVADVMTTDVLAVTPETPLKRVAEGLARQGISGVPVVDAERYVLGVVSEADILVKERGPQRPRDGVLARLLAGPDEELRQKLEARTAGEAMSEPAVTVPATDSVQQAAQLMLERAVNRLPVVDERGRLVGIVTRADLVRAFIRPDAEIRREICEDVLLRQLWLEPDRFDVRVEGGEVRIEGPVASEQEREVVERRVATVPGVVAVEARLVVAA